MAEYKLDADVMPPIQHKGFRLGRTRALHTPLDALAEPPERCRGFRSCVSTYGRALTGKIAELLADDHLYCRFGAV